MKTKACAVLLAMCAAGSLVSWAQKQTVVLSLVTKAGGSVITGGLVIQGVHVSTRGSVLECQQECDLTDHRVRLTADKVLYDTATGDLSAVGAVKMKFLGVEDRRSSVGPK